MIRTVRKSKVHRATVTQADLNYVGSVTVDADLLDAADASAIALPDSPAAVGLSVPSQALADAQPSRTAG